MLRSGEKESHAGGWSDEEGASLHPSSALPQDTAGYYHFLNVFVAVYLNTGYCATVLYRSTAYVYVQYGICTVLYR